MILYLVRHGQSEGNISGFVCGQRDVPLTEQGFEDARRAGKYLEGLTFDRIYSSDLSRAVQTAQTAIPGCDPIRLPLLRELATGDLTGRSVKEIRESTDETLKNALRWQNYAIYGGEDWSMLQARAGKFLKMLEEDPCDQAIAFAHAGFLRATLEMAILDGGRIDSKHIRCTNASVMKLAYENGNWILLTWGAGA